jgi:pectin methylesterase-like acyl-CoA thioesterase
VELLESRGGVVNRLKQVKRRAPLAGTPVVLRVDADAGQLSVMLDGEPVTSARMPFIAATQPTDWDDPGKALLDLRSGPVGVAPSRIGVQVGGAALPLQAGDPPERLPIAGARGGVEASSADPRLASAAIVDGRLVLTPLAAGRTVVTVRGTDDPWAQFTFAVEVGAAFSGPKARTLPGAGLQPRHGERGVPPDTPLRLTFAHEPRLSGAGSVRVIRRRDQAVVAIVRPGDAVVALGPEPRRRFVRMRQIEVDGKAVRVRMPLLLDYDTEYEVVFDPRLLDDGFKGARWRFRTTRYRPVGDSVTVDDDGRAHFRTVQGALDHAMSQPRAKPITVNLREGIYPELLYLRDKDNVSIRGASAQGSIVRAANSDARNPGSGTGQDAQTAGILGGRALFLAQDSDLLELRDLTLHNTTRRSDGHSAQAETIFFNNDKGRLAVRHARFISEQDTLQLTGYAWFYRTLIEGNVDFVWGHNRAALFEESELRTVGDSARPDSGGYLVQARTVDARDAGFVFLRSRLTSGAGPAGNLPPPAGTYLARSPGTAHTWDNVAFIQCVAGPHIALDAWLRKPQPNPAHGRPDAGWREFGNTGEDGKPRSFGGYQMSEREAARLSSRSNVLGGWNPQP